MWSGSPTPLRSIRSRCRLRTWCDDRVRAGVSGMMGKDGFFLAFSGDGQDCSR